MATVVELLIQDAYRFSEILGEGEIANADELTVGLRWLNIAIDEINIDGIEIPLLTEEVFAMTLGEETQVLPDWIAITNLQYALGNILLDIDLLTQNEYLKTARIQSTSGVPGVAYPKRTPTGIDLKVFFKPSQAYPMHVHGYKILTQLAVGDTLTGLQNFMKGYLLFKLAADLRTYYNLSAMPSLDTRVALYRERFNHIKERRLDCVVTTAHAGGNKSYRGGIAQYNIGRGWSP